MNNNFVGGQFTEFELYAAIIGLFQEQNYAYVPGDTINTVTRAHRARNRNLVSLPMRLFVRIAYVYCPY